MKVIGIIGYGNMGSCIGLKLKSAGFNILVFDKDESKISGLDEAEIAADIYSLAVAAEVIILAVKPQDFGGVLEQIKKSGQGKLVISIAAGITTNYIERYLGDDFRVIRTMPNMPARIGKGITCLCKGKSANEIDLVFTRGLFDPLGKTLILDNEEMMDLVTAISGSGPGFIFFLIENNKLDLNNQAGIDKFTKEFVEAAESFGLNYQDALKLAETTVSGSLELLRASGLSVSQLIEQITSKGGTTQAGLKVLNQGWPLEDAVKAARDRARELSRK